MVFFPSREQIADIESKAPGVTTLQTSETFIIPLYELCGLFAYDKLLPSMLMSGCRISLEFETSTNDTMFSTNQLATNAPDNRLANGKNDLQIKNFFFGLKSVQLTDASQRTLNEHSAVHGLEIVYPDYDVTSKTSAQSTENIEIRKACSRALKAFSVIRKQDVIAGVEPSGQIPIDKLAVLFDRLSCMPWDVSKYQWRFGALYFPHQPVEHKDSTGDSLVPVAKESYFHALDAFGRVAPNGVYSDVSFKEYYLYNGVVAVGLERSTLFNLSGVPINNSRILALNVEFKGTDNKRIDTFIKYVKLARVFLNNVEVEQ